MVYIDGTGDGYIPYATRILSATLFEPLHRLMRKMCTSTRARLLRCRACSRIG